MKSDTFVEKRDRIKSCREGQFDFVETHPNHEFGDIQRI